MPRRTVAGVRLGRTLSDASMRPGRNAPENAATLAAARRPAPSFNEAGAKCPGEPCAGNMKTRSNCRFNEAGAKCPGELAEGAVREVSIAASMRPGRNAPEN